jgi:acetoin utilization protein AcuB
MIVEWWMTKDPETISPNALVADAAKLMSQRKVRRLPVIDHARLVGILTKSDLLRAGAPNLNPFSPAARDEPSLQRTVESLMTRSPVTVAPTTPLEDAATKMLERKIGALPVLTAQGSLVGIVTESDVFRALIAVVSPPGRGVRITFEAQRGSGLIEQIVAEAHAHSLAVVSILTVEAAARKTVVVRLVGRDVDGFVAAAWKAGHPVLSVLHVH